MSRKPGADHEGDVLESYVTRTRDKQAALAFRKKAPKRDSPPQAITSADLHREDTGSH